MIWDMFYIFVISIIKTRLTAPNTNGAFGTWILELNKQNSFQNINQTLKHTTI